MKALAQQIADIDLAIPAGRDDKDRQHRDHGKRLAPAPGHRALVSGEQLTKALRR